MRRLTPTSARGRSSATRDWHVLVITQSLPTLPEMRSRGTAVRSRKPCSGRVRGTRAPPPRRPPRTCRGYDGVAFQYLPRYFYSAAHVTLSNLKKFRARCRSVFAGRPRVLFRQYVFASRSPRGGLRDVVPEERASCKLPDESDSKGAVIGNWFRPFAVGKGPKTTGNFENVTRKRSPRN